MFQVLGSLVHVITSVVFDGTCGPKLLDSYGQILDSSLDYYGRVYQISLCRSRRMHTLVFILRHRTIVR
jgi:hypothetical protein